MGPIDYKNDKLFGVDRERFKICFETLISKGLVFDDSFGRMSTRPRTFILPTPLAEGLMEFVQGVETRVEAEKGPGKDRI